MIYELFYPASYPSLGFRSPIVTWGNGTGGSPAQVSTLLRHLASYGFTVIASTLPNTGSGREIGAAARYLVAQDSAAGSVFRHHLDTREVAAVGASQGAGGAVRAATSDPALITAVLTFSLPNTFWVRPNPDCPTRADCMFDPAALTQPVFFLSTHGIFDAVIASSATERSYYHSTTVHAALGIILYSDGKRADHNSIANTASGGNPGGSSATPPPGSNTSSAATPPPPPPSRRDRRHRRCQPRAAGPALGMINANRDRRVAGRRESDAARQRRIAIRGGCRRHSVWRQARARYRCRVE